MRRRPPGSTLFPDPTLFRPARRPLRPRLPRRAGPIMFALEFSALASPVLLLFAFCASAPMSAETSAAAAKAVKRTTTRTLSLLWLLTDASPPVYACRRAPSRPAPRRPPRAPPPPPRHPAAHPTRL